MNKLVYLGIADRFKPAELLKALSVPTEPQSNLHSKLSYLHRPKNPNCQPKDSATLTCPFSRVSKIMVRPLSWVRKGFLFKRPTGLHAHSSLFCCLHSVVGLLMFYTTQAMLKNGFWTFCSQSTQSQTSQPRLTTEFHPWHKANSLAPESSVEPGWPQLRMQSLTDWQPQKKRFLFVLLPGSVLIFEENKWEHEHFYEHIITSS